MIVLDLLAATGFWVAIAALAYSMVSMILLCVRWLILLNGQKSLRLRGAYESAELEPYKTQIRRSFVVFGAELFVLGVTTLLPGLLSAWRDALIR